MTSDRKLKGFLVYSDKCCVCFGGLWAGMLYTQSSDVLKNSNLVCFDYQYGRSVVSLPRFNYHPY